VYANTSSTFGKLSSIGTGNVLLSGNINNAPSYGKVGLTTHVSGTLPVGSGGRVGLSLDRLFWLKSAKFQAEIESKCS
jgi:hypothetical protein